MLRYSTLPLRYLIILYISNTPEGGLHSKKFYTKALNSFSYAVSRNMIQASARHQSKTSVLIQRSSNIFPRSRAPSAKPCTFDGASYTFDEAPMAAVFAGNNNRANGMNLQ